MAKNAKGAFDEILERFGTDEDRQQFQQFTEKNPFLKESVLRQSDYSRKMDEVRDDLASLQKWDEWRKNNWDDDHEMTRTELAKLQKLEATEQKLAELESRALLEGGDVDFNQLEAWGNEFIKKQNLVTPEAIGVKEKELKDFVTGMNSFTARAATKIPYLNQKHFNEFGELFDPEEMLKQAVTKGRFDDLDKFWESEYAAPLREKQRTDKWDKERKELEDKAAAAEERGRQEGARMAGAGATNPTDGNGPTMGAFQRSYLGLNKSGSEDSGAPEVPLGDGGLSAFAANKYIKTGSL